MSLCIGECPSNSPFLKNNGAEAPKGPRPIVNLLSKLSIIFKEWGVVNNVYRGGARV
jgi:hypothetical protein